MTPNYVRNSSTEVSLWCTCDGSGNEWQACQRILHMFSSNTCLRKSAPAPAAARSGDGSGRIGSICVFNMCGCDAGLLVLIPGATVITHYLRSI